jgi:molecular chaperone GrpE
MQKSKSTNDAQKENNQPAHQDTAAGTSPDQTAAIPSSDGSQPDLVDILQQELEQSQQAQAAAIAQSQRALADYANLKKRFDKERQELAQFAAEAIVTQLLGSLDNLERAITYASQQEQDSGLYQGVKMTLQQIDDTLAQVGFKRMDIKPGTTFDPHLHEAIEMVAGDKDKIITVTESGYQLHDIVVRPARVKVGNGEK